MRILGHRGFSYIAPDNTMSSFKKCLEIHADGFETDVQLTKDGQMVMHHNYAIDAQSNGKGLVSELTLDQLLSYDFGSWKNDIYKNEKIVTFDKCLEIAKNFDCVNIELKAPKDRSIPYVKMVYEKINKSKIKDKIIVSAFDHTLLKEYRSLDNDIRLATLIMAPMGNLDLVYYLESIFHDLPLNNITIKMIECVDINECVLEAFHIESQYWSHLIYEFIQSISSIYPNKTFKEIAEAFESQKDLVNYINHLGFRIDCIHPDKLICTKELVENMHKMDVEVNVWTVDKVEDIEHMMDIGVDGIISNRPDVVMQHYKQRG